MEPLDSALPVSAHMLGHEGRFCGNQSLRARLVGEMTTFANGSTPAQPGAAALSRAVARVRSKRSAPHDPQGSWQERGNKLACAKRITKRTPGQHVFQNQMLEQFPEHKSLWKNRLCSSNPANREILSWQSNTPPPVPVIVAHATPRRKQVGETPIFAGLLDCWNKTARQARFACMTYKRDACLSSTF